MDKVLYAHSTARSKLKIDFHLMQESSGTNDSIVHNPVLYVLT